MANLNFKYGLYKNLDSAAFNAGTIYVTTDEKALYVDLPGGSNKNTDRIRIGQTIVYDYAEDFVKVSDHPEFSPEGFYYVEDANMLLRWKGGNKTVTKDDNGNIVFPLDTGWVQINSTSQLETDLSTLTAAVNANSNSITILKGAVGNNVGDIVDGETIDEPTGLYKLIADEVKRATEAENAINKEIGDPSEKDDEGNITVQPTGLYKLINDEVSRATTAEGLLDSRILVLENGIKDKADASALQAEIKRATEVEAAINQEIGSYATEDAEGNPIDGTGLKGKIEALEKAIGEAGEEGTLVDRIADLEANDSVQNNSIKALDEAVNGKTVDGEKQPGLLDDVAGLKTSVENINKIVGEDGSLTEAVSDLDKRLTAIDEETTGRMTVAETAINSLGNRLTAIDEETTGRMTVAETAINSLDDRLTAIDEKTTGRMAVAEAAIDALEAFVGTNDGKGTLATRVVALESNDSIQDNRLSALEQNKADKDWVNDLFDAADAMRLVGTISSIEEYNNLPVDARGGDTYAVTEDIEVEGVIKYHAGDMIVAVDKAGENEGDPDVFDRWEHIKTGTWREYQKLGVGYTEENGKQTEVKLNLTDGSNSTVYNSVEIKTEGAIKVTATANAVAPALTFSLEWESFDA